MFFDVLSGIKELTMDDSLKGRLDFKPFGDEKQVSNYFYTAFIISNLLVYLFNLEFSKRPQLLDIYGFYFTQALHMLFLLTLFMSLRKILSTHEIVLIHSLLPESPQSSQSTQDPTDNGIKKVILLGFNEKKAKLLMLFILAVFGTYLVFIVLGIVLFEYSVDNSYQIPLFIGIEIRLSAILQLSAWISYVWSFSSWFSDALSFHGCLLSFAFRDCISCSVISRRSTMKS